MSNVVPLVRPEAVDQAWEAFSAHVSRSQADMTLFTDRAYMEQWARLERTFKRLFLANEA